MVVPLPVCLPGYASAAASATVCLVPKTKSKFCLLLSGAGKKGAGAGRGNKKCLRCEAWKMCLFRITWLPTACCQLTIAKQSRAEQSRREANPRGVAELQRWFGGGAQTKALECALRGTQSALWGKSRDPLGRLPLTPSPSFVPSSPAPLSKAQANCATFAFVLPAPDCCACARTVLLFLQLLLWQINKQSLSPSQSSSASA